MVFGQACLRVYAAINIARDFGERSRLLSPIVAVGVGASCHVFGALPFARD